MVTKFAHLTEDCFSHILDRVPLKDLMSRASLVSHHWRTMQEEACRRRRSLVLLFGAEPIDVYKESKFNFVFYQHGLDESGGEFNVEKSIELNRLDCDWKFRLDEAKRLMKMLPNIRSFTIVVDSVASKIAITLTGLLLSGWRANLTTLKIISQYMNDDDMGETNKRNIRLLLVYLNKLPALKNLTYEPNDAVPDYKVDDFAFVARLEQFYIYLGIRQEPFMAAWYKYIEPNRGLRRIAFSSKFCTKDDEFEDFLLKKSIQTVCFTHLPLYLPDMMRSLGGLTQLCHRFASITSLYLDDWKEESLADLTRCLKPCTQLVRLCLSVNYGIPPDCKQMTQIRSLKALELEVKSEFHDNFHSWSGALGIAFPNLCSLILVDDRGLCSDDCPYFGEKRVHKKVDRVEKLKQCAEAWIVTMKSSLPDGQKLRIDYGLSVRSPLTLDRSTSTNSIFPQGESSRLNSAADKQKRHVCICS